MLSESAAVARRGVAADDAKNALRTAKMQGQASHSFFEVQLSLRVSTVALPSMIDSELRKGKAFRMYVMPSVDFDDLCNARPLPTQMDDDDVGGTFNAPLRERVYEPQSTQKNLKASTRQPHRATAEAPTARRLDQPLNNSQKACENPRGMKRKTSARQTAMLSRELEQLVEHLKRMDYKAPEKPEDTRLSIKRRQDRQVSRARNDRPSVRDQQIRKHMMAALRNAISLNIDAARFLATSTGWQGPASSQVELDDEVTLKRCLEVLKYVLIEPEPGQTIPFLDRRRFIISLIILRDGNKWHDLTFSANKLLDFVAARFNICDGSKTNRRGDYTSHHFGISMGQGPKVRSGYKPWSFFDPLSKEPHNLRPRDENNHRMIMELMNTETFRIIVAMVDDFMKIYARKLYDHYEEVLQKILEQLPHLRKNHSQVFAAATVNLGPQTVTKPHYDSMNLAYGLCAIIVFGTFDADKGGFLVVKELGVVIRVQSGSIVFLPSAVVQHYNIRLHGSSETRYSLTLYSAASLFRWVDNGFKTNTQLQSMPMSEQLKAQRKADDSMRMKKGVGLFNRVDVEE